jgi:glycosyltransferase involved in cell wall biosynthesis
MRIAFTLIHSASWTGGYNYLINLFRVIDKYQTDKIKPILFCGEDATESDLEPFYEFDNIEVIRSPVFNTKNKLLNILRTVLYGIDSAVTKLFQQYHIDVVFENATYYGRRSPFAIVSWLPDFQHRHLREQFNFIAYWKRELGFRAQTATDRTIMLSSEDSRKDCEYFYPKAIGKTEVVHFSSPINADLIEEFPEHVINKYQLPLQFFYLPNQFWKHKNHVVVIEALGLLKQQGINIVVAVTGNPLDPRHPEYIKQLKSKIEFLGLHDNFRIFGLIPRSHVISLMRTCTALINPSYFEGWSSTVEESRALGIPLLLSDISVHREQMKNKAVYFDPDSADDLADKLKKMYIDNSLLEVARKPVIGSDQSLRCFAQDFVAVVNKAFNRL